MFNYIFTWQNYIFPITNSKKRQEYSIIIMIASFFNKAKPIHFVIVSTVLLMVFVVAKYYNLGNTFNLSMLAKQAFLFMICLATVFVFDFLVGRNNLTKKNSYRILIFVLFIALLPNTILNSKLLISNFFVLLALRRIISLKSNKEIKKKLFDSAFWISIATLFYFWAILFYILIIAGLILYRIVDIKNWIIPFTGTSTVAILGTSYMILTGHEFIHFFIDQIDLSFDFSSLNSKRTIISATVILSYGIWSLFYFGRRLKSKSKKARPAFILVVHWTIIGLLVLMVAPNKNGSEFLFLFAPLAIIVANYLEAISEKWFKDTLLYGLLMIPIFILML